MAVLMLPIDKPVKYGFTGKFESPDPEWRHMHRVIEDYELVIPTSGTLYLSANEHKYALKGRLGGVKAKTFTEYLLMPPGTYQYGYKASQCSFYWMHFAHEGAVRRIENYEQKAISEDTSEKLVLPETATVQNFEKIILYMRQLQDSVREYNSKNLNDYMTTVVLCELQCQVKSSRVSSKKNSQLYNDILDYITYYIDTDIKVTDIAGHFGYNQKYLSYMFKASSGVTLKRYILREKISRSKYMLSDTNDTISQIASAVGYSDVHNFMRSFKKECGVTPSEYRNIHSRRMLFYK